MQLIAERGSELANVPSSRHPMTPVTSGPMPAGRNSSVAETSSTACSTAVPPDLPGADLVSAGIEALRRGEPTMEALLVMVGARRMCAAGLDIPPGLPLGRYPEHALYSAVAATHPLDAHSRYNALVRRLVSFERALESLHSSANPQHIVLRDDSR